MPIRIAFAGTGYINKIHAEAARRTAGVVLAAVVNHRPESLAAFAADFDIPRRYATVEDLLRDGGVDALVVSTPNSLHAPQTIAALQAGVAVMVEKPMAMDAPECAAMLRASHASEAPLMVAHCFRFDPDVLWLREQAQAGRLGRILRTKAYGVHVGWGPGGWFTRKELAGGGAMADMGIHAIDTTRFLLGDPLPTSVYARIGTYYGGYDVDDTGVVIVNWDHGAVSYIESGWWQPHADGPQAAVQLYGTQGFGSVFPTCLELPDIEKRAIETVQSGLPERQEHVTQSLYDDQMAYFIECVRSRQTPVPGGREGWINMQIVDAAYESARTNRVVELNGREEL